ncbi:hypothetical protein EV667_0129 [Ancylobacter aquaticus]|uniref:Uncharacterized protein n=1 Tax=Ancylobacter aquaticus TaxID=100 RepID=A0A4R1I423_ANCAQ|nr:hypothetical protein [Ancylobacter aquaticus]TCK30044.1 hypothetical protein EV667_0129 [Ancylobacter aquaticus]
MRLCSALPAAALLAATAVVPMASASAETLTAQAAQRFVIGQTFSYTCYEGTVGSGRIMPDGSVAGTIQMRGKGNARHVTLPAGTIMVRGESVCAKLKGMAFQPCFELEKTDKVSFRGNLAGADRLWCEFKRGGSGRTRLAERAVSSKTAAARAEAAAAQMTAEIVSEK